MTGTTSAVPWYSKAFGFVGALLGAPLAACVALAGGALLVVGVFALALAGAILAAGALGVSLAVLIVSALAAELETLRRAASREDGLEEGGES